MSVFSDPLMHDILASLTTRKEVKVETQGAVYYRYQEEVKGRYNILYADPAWTYATYSKKGKGKSPEQHYRCMTQEELEALPIGQIAAKDACLFMWSIDTHIPQCLALAAHWGFEYSTKAFEWAKTTKVPEWDGTLLTKGRFHFGMGHWTRANSETCFLFTKGKPKRVARNVRRLVVSEKREHSRKPDRIRNDILDLCGDLPRIELFARTTDEGWDVWGNETKKFK